MKKISILLLTTILILSTPQLVSYARVLEITPEADEAGSLLAAAMDLGAAQIDSATMGDSDLSAQIVGAQSLAGFPTAGDSFIILSTGEASRADTANESDNLSTMLDGLNNSQGNDMVQLRIGVKAAADQNCASFDFAFLSEEYPSYAETLYSDVFTAEVGGTALSIDGVEVASALNFAKTADDRLISAETSLGLSGDTGTTYNGKTATETAQTPVTAGAVNEFVFTIQDLGDPIYDSAVFIDNFVLTQDPNCMAGIVSATVVDPPGGSIYLPFTAR